MYHFLCSKVTLLHVSLLSIDLKESERLATLYLQIQTCDSVLGKIEDTLQKFQSSIGSISGEIKMLQEYSLNKNIKLKNREKAGTELKQMIAQLVIPPDLQTYALWYIHKSHYCNTCTNHTILTNHIPFVEHYLHSRKKNRIIGGWTRR